MGAAAARVPRMPRRGRRQPDPVAFGQFAQARRRALLGRRSRTCRASGTSRPGTSRTSASTSCRSSSTASRSRRRGTATMLNAFADAVHAVHRDNVVIAGGLAPFRDITPRSRRRTSDWGPLSFMRELLCVSTAGEADMLDAGRLRRLGDAPVHLGRPDAPRRPRRTTSRSATSPKMPRRARRRRHAPAT